MTMFVIQLKRAYYIPKRPTYFRLNVILRWKMPACTNLIDVPTGIRLGNELPFQSTGYRFPTNVKPPGPKSPVISSNFVYIIESCLIVSTCNQKPCCLYAPKKKVTGDVHQNVILNFCVKYVHRLLLM